MAELRPAPLLPPPLLLKRPGSPAASLTAKFEPRSLHSNYFQLHFRSPVSETVVFYLKPFGTFVLEIIQQGNKWGRNCLQINLVWFGNKKDSNHEREVLKLPSDTKCYVGRGGGGKPSN